MQVKKTLLFIVFFFVAQFAASAQQTDKSAPPVVTIEKAPAGSAVKSPTDLLPDSLAGVVATSEIQQYQPENLAAIAGDQATIFQDYKVVAAASRNYGAIRLDIFQTESPFAAFGLFHYLLAQAGGKPLAKGIGSDRASLGSGQIFWKSRFFVKLSGPSSLAAAVAEKIPVNDKDAPPSLLQSLPADLRAARSERYFLGGQTLGSYVPHAGELFLFDGDAEAAFAEYQQGAAKKRLDKTSVPIKLVIVEYHTPQFATAAMRHAEEVFNGLAPEEQNRLVLKRVGNFIVEAANVEDREFAEKLVGAIEYPYEVKMLKDLGLPHTDPDHNRKAAEMLLSTFSLIGVTGVIVLVCGSIIGTAIFFKRRKQQRAIFSDAGGLLRLLDPIEDAILRLPPRKRE